MKLNKYILSITFFLNIIKIIPSYSYNAKEILDNPSNYKYILCSGNGEPSYNHIKNEVTCACKEGYTNEPSEEKKIRLNGHLIQCSYKRKSRFTTLFYSLCLPFGFDFLYLERYKIFALIFCFIVSVITLNIVMFILNYKMNLKNKENKFKYKMKKLRNFDDNRKERSEEKKYKIIKILNVIASIGLLLHLSYMIIVIIMHIVGYIEDYYGVKTENDLNYLFQRSSYN